MLSFVLSLLIAAEAFHAVSHLAVLGGWRRLPRRVLVKQRPYFLVDLACVTSSFLIHGRWWFVILVQNIQHAFYFITWDQSNAAKRVISWSALEWDRGRWNQLDLVLGTLFDLVVHVASAYFLCAHAVAADLPWVSALLLGLALGTALVFAPFLAWATKDDVPTWVAAKLRPLSDDQRQEVAAFETIARKFAAN